MTTLPRSARSRVNRRYGAITPGKA